MTSSFLTGERLTQQKARGLRTCTLCTSRIGEAPIESLPIIPLNSGPPPVRSYRTLQHGHTFSLSPLPKQDWVQVHAVGEDMTRVKAGPAERSDWITVALGCPSLQNMFEFG